MSGEIAKREPGSVTALSPKSIDEALKLAELLARSNMIPKTYYGKPNDVLVAVPLFVT